jgi:transcriptional regulator with XRE-family HTH domain
MVSEIARCGAVMITPFGIKIRELRQTHGITMANMAAHLNVSSAYLSQLEHGKRGVPGVIMLDQICALFGLIWEDAEDLKTLAALSHPRVMIDTSHLGKEAMIAANLFAQLLPRVSEEEAQAMAEWLKTRYDQL